MIFGNKEFISRYQFLDKKILDCFEYAKNNDLLHFEKGSHEIDGDIVFVNIVEYDTKERKERFWEAHKNYIDLHFMLLGEERIDLNFIQNMKQLEFVEKDDFLPLKGESNASVVLRDGDFLLCYPEDGHMTAIKNGDSQTIKKAIFKIKL